MLTIIIPENEFYDEATSEFIHQERITLHLEHSLASLSKWESRFEKPFLGAGEKTDEEVMGYIEAMILSDDFPPEAVSRLSQDNLDIINKYIEKKHTATWIADQTTPSRSTEVITSELIYYWLTVYNIPFECDQWNLNRLFMLIRVCGVKSQKPKKMSPTEAAAQRRALNEQRRKQYNTSG